MDAPSLSLVVIRAADLQASLAFYRGLGLQFAEERHGSGPVHYSHAAGGLVLEIHPQKAGAAEPPAHTTMLGFTVHSLDSCLADLLALGCEPKSAPQDSEWGRWVNVSDPDGRTVRIDETLN